jgi:hypothetical protein
MFNVEQPGSEAEERGGSLAPVVIALVNTYAGLSSAVAGLCWTRRPWSSGA